MGNDWASGDDDTRSHRIYRWLVVVLAFCVSRLFHFYCRSLAALHRVSADSGSNELCHFIYGPAAELCGSSGAATWKSDRGSRWIAWRGGSVQRGAIIAGIVDGFAFPGGVVSNDMGTPGVAFSRRIHCGVDDECRSHFLSLVERGKFRFASDDRAA